MRKSGPWNTTAWLWHCCAQNQWDEWEISLNMSTSNQCKKNRHSLASVGLSLHGTRREISNKTLPPLDTTTKKNKGRSEKQTLFSVKTKVVKNDSHRCSGRFPAAVTWLVCWFLPPCAVQLRTIAPLCLMAYPPLTSGRRRCQERPHSVWRPKDGSITSWH